MDDGINKDGRPKHNTQPDEQQPEHRSDRRRFLVWALMLGAIPPERVVDRIVEEVQREVAQ